MKVAQLIAKWEARLKAEGLAPLDGSYRQKSRIICYAIPERVSFAVHSQSFVMEFFVRCEEFSRRGHVRWPTIWRPFSQGVPYRTIAERLGVSHQLVHQRVTKMRQDMREFFAKSASDAEDIPPEAEVLEVFVESTRKR